MKERRLVSIRRQVARARRSEYDAAWTRLHAAATAHGAHAWRFLSAARDDLYIEFLEFAPDADPREEPEAAAALRELEASFGEAPAPAPIEEWRSIREAGE